MKAQSVLHRVELEPFVTSASFVTPDYKKKKKKDFTTGALERHMSS